MNDGGPFFPGKQNICGVVDVDTPGISIRDWYAGQALSGYFAYFSDVEAMMPSKQELAERCYQFADAMLAERAKTK